MICNGATFRFMSRRIFQIFITAHIGIRIFLENRTSNGGLHSEICDQIWQLALVWHEIIVETTSFTSSTPVESLCHAPRKD